MDMRAITAICEAFDLDPVRDGLHIATAAAPSFDAATPTLVLAPFDDALLRALRDRYPASHPVRLAGADGAIEELALADLTPDRTAAALYLPPLSPEADLRDARGLLAIIRHLRDPEGGCPWDLEQTHESLKPHLIEEAYEALDALDRGDPAVLREELGDLLLQVVLHARIAEQSDEFTTADVIEGLGQKLLRRHPHVFGEVTARTAGEVVANWDALKRAEREHSDADDTSALAGVPRAMPALAYSQAILGRAERAGFAWPGTDDVLAKIAEEAHEITAAADPAARREELGDLLLALVSLARALDLDAEEALRFAAAKFGERFRSVEKSLHEGNPSTEGLLALWAQAKQK